MSKRLILITLLLISGLFAQNYEDCINPIWNFQQFGSTNNALANNSTTLSSGMSGLGANPATLGLHDNFLLGLSFGNHSLTQNSKFYDSYDSFNQSDLMSSNLDGISAILPVNVYRGSLVFALSYSNTANYFNQADVLYDFGISDTTFSIDNKYKETGAMDVYRFGFAFEFQKNFFIGTSMNYYRGNQHQQYNYTDIAISKDFYDPIYKTVEVNPEYRGLNFNLGLLYVASHFKFGANLQTPLTLNTDEDYSHSENWTNIDNEVVTIEESARTEYKISAPSAVSAGIEYNIGNIALLVDMKMQNWHNMEFDSDWNSAAVNSEIRNNLKTAFDYGFGIKSEFLNNYEVMLGYRIIDRPYYDIDDENKKVHLTGFGINTRLIDNLNIGISYQFEFGKNTIDREYFEYPIYRKYTRQNLTVTTSLIF